MSGLLRWVLGMPVLVMLFAFTGEWLGGDASAREFVVAFLLGQIAGLPGWLSVFQPVVATIGLVLAGLAAGLAFGLPLGLWWGRGLPWSCPLGVLAAACLGAFPLGLGLFLLHAVVVDLGWIVPGYLAIERGGGVGVAGRYLLGVGCLAPMVAGEVATVVAGEIRRAAGDRRQQFDRALGMSRRAIFSRWAVPPALVATGSILPTLVGALFCWAAAIEWIFHVGGIGRVTVRSALQGDVSGALSGILLMLMLVGLLRVACAACLRGGRRAPAPVYCLGHDRPPVGRFDDLLARRIWRWRLAAGAGLMALVPCLPLVFSWLLPVASWNEAHLAMMEILASEGYGAEAGGVDKTGPVESPAAYGGRLLGQAATAGYGALAGALVSALLGGAWGAVAAVSAGRLPGMLLRSLSDLLAGVPVGLLLVVLVVAVEGGGWGARCLLAVLLASRLVSGVERTVFEAMPAGYLEAAKGFALGRMVALVRAVGQPVAAAFPWWVVSVIHWWLYVPALVAFLAPAGGFQALGGSMATGMATLWEQPLVVLAPCLLLGMLGMAFNLARVILPDRAVDGRTSLR